MMVGTLLVAAFIFSRLNIGRFAGLLFLTIYGIYILGLVNGWDFPGLGAS